MCVFSFLIQDGVTVMLPANVTFKEFMEADISCDTVANPEAGVSMHCGMGSSSVPRPGTGRGSRIAKVWASCAGDCGFQPWSSQNQ